VHGASASSCLLPLLHRRQLPLPPPAPIAGSTRSDPEVLDAAYFYAFLRTASSRMREVTSPAWAECRVAARGDFASIFIIIDCAMRAAVLQPINFGWVSGCGARGARLLHHHRGLRLQSRCSRSRPDVVLS
jgi:hypothetical protein